MNKFIEILKALRHLPELVKFMNKQDQINTEQYWKIQNTFEIAKESREFVRKRTEAHVDVGYKGPSTIVLTGNFRGRDFVEIYQIDQPDFEYLRRTLSEMNRRHQVRRIDGPIEFCRHMKRELEI